MRADELRAFLDRPWDRLRALKDAHHERRLDDAGPEAALALGDLLRTSTKKLSGRAAPDARETDLADLIRLKRLLERTSARRR